jgi:hypothetical protein
MDAGPLNSDREVRSSDDPFWETAALPVERFIAEAPRTLQELRDWAGCSRGNRGPQSDALVTLENALFWLENRGRVERVREGGRLVFRIPGPPSPPEAVLAPPPAPPTKPEPARWWMPGIGKTDTPAATGRLALIMERARRVAARPLETEEEEQGAADGAAWDEQEIPNGPETVSTLEENDGSEPRLVGNRVKADQLQTRTTTCAPSFRSRSKRSRSDRAPASLGTESPVVEVPRGALNDGGAAPKIRPRSTPVGGAKPDTLVDADRNRLTDPGSTPGRSTEEKHMEYGLKQYDTKKWMTNGEAAKLLGVGGNQISNLAAAYSWARQRVGRFVVYDRATVETHARTRRELKHHGKAGMTVANKIEEGRAKKRKTPTKKKPRKKAAANVALHVDGKKLAETVAAHRHVIVDDAKTEMAPKADLKRQVRALLECYDSAVPGFGVAELVGNLRMVVA